jgi:hypothetical protein
MVLPVPVFLGIIEQAFGSGTTSEAFCLRLVCIKYSTRRKNPFPTSITIEFFDKKVIRIAFGQDKVDPTKLR